ncbi:MAG: hypothetical protein JWM33_3079 [Caulobacteraceae bacterium]|nr:hypothetical protein [Caulobacteraceae bacterium]
MRSSFIFVSEFARTLLFLAFAGAAVTLVGSGVRWLRDQQSRIRACLVKGLGGRPDVMLVGEGGGAAINFRAGLVAVAWDNGAWRLVYPLEELRGGELIVDSQVAARAIPGEARRVLDQVVSSAGQVILRLIFDDPARPHFDLLLYTAANEARRDQPSPAAAIAAANEWLARIDALQRRPVKAAAVARPEPEDDFDEDEPELL